jgi:SpoVK/Ycf46/Vps4 family AAA+-type ATPase
VLFEMPGVDERVEIWKLQIHPNKTPLADDVDFRQLSERYVASGGDIKNAVIKAAAAAAAEPGPDYAKKITQKHFEAAMEDVIAARSIMQQSVFKGREGAPDDPVAILQKAGSRLRIVTATSLVVGLAALVASAIALWVSLAR